MENNPHITPSAIRIRLLEQRDSKAFLQLLVQNRERLQRYFPLMCSTVTSPWKSARFVRRKRRECRQKNYYPFVIEDTASGELIGYISIKTIDNSIPKGELAYFIAERWSGKGISSHALAEVSNRAFQQFGFYKLIVRINADNPASRAVAIKAGFQSEGIQQSDFRTHEGLLVAAEYLGKSRS